MLLETDDASPSHGRTLETAPRIVDLVPHDPLFTTRVTAMSIYGVIYLWWFRERGIIIDRISVAISVGIFLVCAFMGKPWRRWGQLAIDATLYALMWFTYEMTRGAADRLGFPYQLDIVRTFDRLLFLGTDPTVWMQDRFFDPQDVKWYDNVASAVYYTHFVVPVIALAVLWAVSRVQWVRFMKRFATLLAISCALFVIMPTVPPWMASSPRHDYRVFEPLARHTGRGFQDMGFTGFVKGWQQALDWGNAVAAMPSLHTAFALFVPAFFLPLVRWWWLKVALLCFPVAMLASLVYFGEHWVVDGLAGALLVGVSFALWGWIERRQRATRAARARAALG